MSAEPTTQVTMDNYKLFRAKYLAAAKTSQKTFVFEGQEVSVDYAKYVLQYFYSKKL
jgi:hypothetical protein